MTNTICKQWHPTTSSLATGVERVFLYGTQSGEPGAVWKSRWLYWAPEKGTSLVSLTVSVDVKQHWERNLMRARSCVKVKVAVLGSSSLVSLTVSVDVKQHWERNLMRARSCVKVKVAVLGSLPLTVCTVSMDVKQQWTGTEQHTVLYCITLCCNSPPPPSPPLPPIPTPPLCVPSYITWQLCCAGGRVWAAGNAPTETCKSASWPTPAGRSQRTSPPTAPSPHSETVHTPTGLKSTASASGIQSVHTNRSEIYS